MLKPQIDVYMGCDAPWEEAETVLFGAPFDSTTSNRPGTRFGPSALRRESYGLELYSPYQDRDLSDCAVLDSGDLELPMGSSALALEEIEARAAEILSAGKRPFLLGGEHLVTLGAFRAVFRSTLTPTPTCARSTWGWSSPTPACCAGAGTSLETDAFSSSASAPGTAPSGSGDGST